MPARSKSSAIKVLSVKKGNAAIVPWDRIVDGKEGELPPPPKEFTEQERRAWDMIIDQIPPAILSKSDYIIIASLAVMWARFIREKDTVNPAFILQLRQLCTDLGLNPSARNGMMTAKPDPTKKPLPGVGPERHVNPFKLI